MQISIPKPVNLLVDRLESAGFEVFCVGGCVRDSLLGREPGDWDLATSALPHQTEAVFTGWQVVGTGRKHGTLTVISEGNPVEITTFRRDGVYRDGRHPEQVTFTPRLADDLARRDFTVNALAFSPRTGIIDRFDGLDDLRNKLIRAVGDPARRFEEDALRIVRALRFASTLGFSVEPATASALRNQFRLLEKVSAERLFSELCKLVCGEHADAVVRQFPEVIALLTGAFSPDGVQLHLLPARPGVRLAMLMHRFSPAQADAALLRLKADNATRRTVVALLSRRDQPLPVSRTGVRRLLSELGVQPLRELLDFQAALGRETGPAQQNLQQVLTDGDCWNLGMLAVNGRDLLSVGVPAGRELGAVLRFLLVQVIEGRLPNRKPELLHAAAEALPLDPATFAGGSGAGAKVDETFGLG